MCLCVISWGAHTHTSWPRGTGTANLVQQISHPGITHFSLVTCCIEVVFSHHLSKGTLGNKQVGAQLAQISRLLGVELMGAGHFQREDRDLARVFLGRMKQQ